MRFDPFTYQALCFATYEAMKPKHGSSLTFLLASPGETQVTFRRPADASTAFTIQCGSSTWYNEPIFRILDAMAPKMEAFDIASWSRQHGEPPVQVICITDGMDNMSPPHLAQLSTLVESIKQIVGPKGNKELYRPMADPNEKCSRDEVVGRSAAKVPVWLIWLAMGSGGKQFLKSCRSVPKEVAIVDAVVPQGKGWEKGGFFLADSAGDPGFEVGDRVSVRPPAWIRNSGVPSLMDPDRLRNGVISHLPSEEFPKYTILYEDEVEEVGVEVERISGNSSKAGTWIPPGTLEAMTLVKTALLQPSRLLRLVDPESRIASIWNRAVEPAVILQRAGIELMSEDGLVRARLSMSMISLRLPECSPPEGFLQQFMEAVGPAARGLDATGRHVACTIMHAALERVAQGCVVYSEHLYEEFHESRRSIPDSETMTEESVNTWLEAHCQPSLDALSFLVRQQVLSVQQVVIDCQHEGCCRCKATRQQAFVFDGPRALSVSIAALSAVCHLTSPDWDALGRCWERCLHTNPSVALAQPREQVVLRKRPVHDAASSSARLRRSSSTSAITRYSRRSAPVLWGAGEALISSQAICSGPRSFRRLSNRTH